MPGFSNLPSVCFFPTSNVSPADFLADRMSAPEKSDIRLLDYRRSADDPERTLLAAAFLFTEPRRNE